MTMKDEVIKLEMPPLKVYACYSMDRDIRLRSSSGAVFSLLAEYVLKQQGTIYGVAMSEDCYSAEYISVTTITDLEKIRGSKYLQAKVGNTFKRVKDDLLSKKIVLFTGTGCQVNGLKRYLGKEYENLICVDVICHGVPSPALWKKYAQYQEDKNGGKLKSIRFRCKDDSLTDFGIQNKLNSNSDGREHYLYSSKDTDPYMQMFLRDECLRPSCYNCAAKKSKLADMTIADFWGIDEVAPEMNDGMGTSLVIIRTEKGRALFEKIRCGVRLKEVTYEEGVRCNSSEYRSCVRPKERDSFFTDMSVMDFDELKIKYASPIRAPFLSRVKRKIKRVLQIGGGGTNESYGLLFVFSI